MRSGEGGEAGQQWCWYVQKNEKYKKVSVLIINNFNIQGVMGSFRSQPELTKHTHTGTHEKITYAITHMCGWRIYMQDAHITNAPFTEKKLGLFGVFDGHGGAQCAVFVERHFANELKVNQNFKRGDYEKALKETFLKMDQLLITENGKNQIISIQKQMKAKQNAPTYDEPSHAGCTANVVLITPEYIYCANAGDSRAVASINKKPVALSFDHKPEDEAEIKRITKAGGQVQYGRVNGNLNLSRALGDLEYKGNSKIPPEEQIITANPDIIKIANQNFDFIIMGCDGIWQVKNNNDMVEWVAKRLDAKKEQGKILEELLDELVAKDTNREYGMDNMSAILITFNGRGK